MNKIKNYFFNLKQKLLETSVALKVCFLLLGNIFLPALISSFGFIFNISINSFTYILSEAILFILYILFFYNREKKKEFFLSLVISIIVILASIFVSSKIYDNSVDGWGYHNPAIIKLSEGWNPLYEHYDDENIIGIWSEHYPKVIWLYGATLFSLTNLFFCGYTFNIIIAFATLFLMFDIFRKKTFNIILSIIFSMIITFGTITISQMFTLYNDGVFGLCILGLLLLYNGILNKEYKLNMVTILIVSFYLSILANIKFNGALYAFLIAAIYSVILFIKKELKFNKDIITYVLTIGFCVCVVASNTYITNAIYHKNIGYPIIGDNKIEIIKQFIPAYIHPDDGNIEAFAKAITSSSFYEYIYSPFYVSEASVYACASTADCRINGFGPLYQSLVILVIIFTIIYITKQIRKIIQKEITFELYIKENYYKYIPFLFMIIFFLMAPASWWVRYVPFMHAVPLIIVIFFHDDWNKINLSTLIVYSLIVIYLISMLGIGHSMIKQSIYFSNTVNNEIDIIKDYSKEHELNIAPIDSSLIHNSYRQKMTYKYLGNKRISYKLNNTYECKIIRNLDALAISIVDCSGDESDTNN